MDCICASVSPAGLSLVIRRRLFSVAAAARGHDQRLAVGKEHFPLRVGRRLQRGLDPRFRAAAADESVALFRRL